MKRHLLITAGIVGVIVISCVGCGKERDTAIEEGSIETAAVSDNDVSDSRDLAIALLLGETNDSDEEINDSDEEINDSDKETVQSDKEADLVENSITKNVQPLLEELFSYEKSEYGDYLMITGIATEYRKIFWSRMKEITGKEGYLLIPGDINGIPVEEIGDNAFAGEKIIKKVDFPDSIWGIAPGAFQDTSIAYLDLPDGLELIGEDTFANCNLTYLRFPDSVSFIGDRAFNGNKELWTVLIPDVSAYIGEDAFADCSSDFLLCYGDNPQKKENHALAYAEENGMDSTEIFLSMEPVVRYPAQPLVLEPEVRNFFYGDLGGYEDWDEERWCTWEEDETAPNFGYSDWQWIGCSSWCGVDYFTQEAYASSTLSSQDGRYSVDNILTQNRELAWAENVEGSGIGESITYRQSCSCYGNNNKWEEIWMTGNREPAIDGFMRYTEICIVNGYARDEKVWEENGRIKELLMYVENRPYAYLELEDTILPQYFTLPEDDIKVLGGGMIEVRFEITDVYPGSVYEDTCLTGLVMEFSGRHAH